MSTGQGTLSWSYDTRVLQVMELRMKDQATCTQCCAGDDDTCVGTTGTCYCDAGCKLLGDCCANYCGMCGGC